jgi:hypothetical protein
MPCQADLVTTERRVLRLLMEKTTFRYGEQRWILQVGSDIRQENYSSWDSERSPYNCLSSDTGFLVYVVNVDGVSLVIQFTELLQNVTKNMDYDLIILHTLQFTIART